MQAPGQLRDQARQLNLRHFTLSVSSLGSLAVQGNFWIKSFLMPHSIELEIDQTYLKTLIERLKEALKRVTSEGVTQARYFYQKPSKSSINLGPQPIEQTYKGEKKFVLIVPD